MQYVANTTKVLFAGLVFLLSSIPLVPIEVSAAETIDVAAGEQDFTVTTTAPGPELSEHHQALASGDLNGDGVADLVVGAAGRLALRFLPPIRGEVYVLFGPLPAGGVADLSNPADVSVKVVGADAGDMLGQSVAVADMNNDGNDDLIVGAVLGDGPLNDRPNAGEVYVFFGPFVSGTVLSAAAADVTIHGVDADDWLGFTVAGGDVSGDGVADLIIGALGGHGPSNTRPDFSGEVHILFGPLTAGSIDLSVTPADATIFGRGQLGSSVAAGDVTNDGHADLVVGAASAGAAYVFFGPFASGTIVDLDATAADVRVTGVVGSSVAVADITGDGIGDLITGAQIARNLNVGSPAFGEETGAVYAFFGPLVLGMDVLASAAAELTVYIPDVPLITGEVSSVAAGDVTGDGTADLIIGAKFGKGLLGTPPPGSNGPGEVYALFGPFSPGTVIDLEMTDPDIKVTGRLFNGKLGASVATGDVTGDGIDDLLLEASFVFPGGGGLGVGEAYVIFGPLGIVPFATFDAKMEIDLEPLAADDEFEVKASFTLGATSNGINPLTEIVSLQLRGGSGTFSTTIPAGSFKQDTKRRFKFEGVIDGVELEVVIRPLGGGSFEFKAEGEGADLTGTMNPVTVTVTIGNDGGNTTVTAEID